MSEFWTGVASSIVFLAIGVGVWIFRPEVYDYILGRNRKIPPPVAQDWMRQQTNIINIIHWDPNAVKTYSDGSTNYSGRVLTGSDQNPEPYSYNIRVTSDSVVITNQSSVTRINFQ